MKELSDTVIKQYGNIKLYSDRIEIENKSTTITKTESQIMLTLMNSPEEAVSREELYSKAWPGIIVLDNTVNVHISRLKKKLGEYGHIIKSASKRGYLLTLNPQKIILSPIEQKIIDYMKSVPETPTQKMIKKEMEKFGYSRDTTHVMLHHLKNKINGKNINEHIA